MFEGEPTVIPSGAEGSRATVKGCMRSLVVRKLASPGMTADVASSRSLPRAHSAAFTSSAAALARAGRDVDDLARLLGHHRGDGGAGAEERPGQIRLQDQAPIVRGDFVDRSADVGAGVVHQDVEPPERIERLLDKRLGLL